MKLDLDIEEITNLYINELWSISKIAEKFKVNHGTIKLRLSKNNITFRTHSENQKIAMSKPEVKEKISAASKKVSHLRSQTNLTKYGTSVPANNSKINQRWKEKHLKEYGVEFPNQRKDVISKRKETCINKYGTNNVSKLIEVKKKISNNRWRNKSKDDLNIIQEKTKNTWIRNLGTDNPLKNNDTKEKVRQKRWQQKTKEELERIQEKSNVTRIENKQEEVLEKLNLLNLEILEPFKNVTDYIQLKCLKCGIIFKSVLDYVFHDYGLCPKCFPLTESRTFGLEIDLYIRSIINEDVYTNNRRFLPSGKEIDTLIPDKKLAIECDGLYYHSEPMLNIKKYHLEKTEECNQLGFQLIHIFEDEWIFKKEIVKSRLRQILNVNKSTKIYARKCNIKEITSKEKDEFLIKNHIQGSDISKIRLGAFYNEELVSVMTFSKGNISKGITSKNFIWELNRFCSSNDYHVIGIASKLLEYFKRNYEWKEIFSYADRRWSEGKLYYKLGFKLESITNLNYWYVKGIHRIHRFGLRKRLNEPKNIPEWILRQKEGYRRIWDCGNLKFSLRNRT